MANPTITSLVLCPSSGGGKRAFSLIELAIALTVIGLIVGAIWFAAAAAHEKARVSSALTEFNMVSQNMTNLLQGGYGMANPCSGGASPPCDITMPLINTGAIPEEYVNRTAPPNQPCSVANPCTARHPWNETTFVMHWMMSSPRTYRMSFYNASLQGCLGLILQNTACVPGRPSCPTGIVVASGAVPEFNPATSLMTTTQAQTLCNSNSYNGSGANSVEFDFTQ